MGEPDAAGQGASMLSVGVSSVVLLSTLSSLQLLLQEHTPYLKPLELSQLLLSGLLTPVGGRGFLPRTSQKRSNHETHFLTGATGHAHLS